LKVFDYKILLGSLAFLVMWK